MQMKQQLTAMDRVRLASSDSVLGPVKVCVQVAAAGLHNPAVLPPSAHHAHPQCRGKLSDKYILSRARGEPPC